MSAAGNNSWGFSVILAGGTFELIAVLLRGETAEMASAESEGSTLLAFAPRGGVVMIELSNVAEFTESLREGGRVLFVNWLSGNFLLVGGKTVGAEVVGVVVLRLSATSLAVLFTVAGTITILPAFATLSVAASEGVTMGGRIASVAIS